MVSAQDYYPFGMLMPGQSFNTGSYAYGFGGKRQDDDIKGEGNSYDFGARIYDPRVSRWLSIDPVNKAWLSPYQYASANPINLADPDGGDEIHFHYLTIERNIPTMVRTSEGKWVQSSMKEVKKYTYAEVIKDNNRDRFFVHGQTNNALPTTIEFYPNSGERTKSGVTKFCFGL